MPHRALPRLSLLALAVAQLTLAPALAAEPASAANTAVHRSYDIPAGPLEAALNRFGREAGITLSFPTSLTEGLRSPGLHGSHGTDAALARLLQGTGLAATARGDGSHVLYELPAVDGETALAPVTVTAGADRSGTTEGTGSYTQSGPSSAATGLALTLRETPQSVSVLTQQQLKDRNVYSLDDALANVTGITVTKQDTGRTYYYARGFQVDRVMVDGMPTAFSVTQLMGERQNDMLFYDRVEVVRGPTGLMTGAGEPSATINLVRKRASNREFAGEVSLGYGSWDTLRTTADISTPLSESGNVRGRIVGLVKNNKSHVDLYDQEQRAFYGVVEADITSRTTASIGFDYQKSDTDGATWVGLPLFFSDGTKTDWSRAKTAAADWSYFNTENKSVFANLEHRFDSGWKINAQLLHRKTKAEGKVLYVFGNLDRETGTGLSAMPWYPGDYDGLKQSAADLKVSGPISLFGQEHELIFGATGNWTDFKETEGALPASLWPSVGDFRDWDGSIAQPDASLAGDISKLQIKTRQTGFYAAGRFSLTDDLKLILGGRHSDWSSHERSVTRRQREFTPYAGLIYDISRDFSVYASYTDIFKPQSSRDASGSYLDPRTGTNHEVGVKGEHFNGKLNTSLAIFRLKEDNVAEADGSNRISGTTQQAYRAVKGVTSEGFELQASGEISEGWNVGAGLSRTIAKKPDGATYRPNVPRTQLSLQTAYELSGRWNGLTVGGAVTWQNSTYGIFRVGSLGNLKYKQGSFTVVDVMARYDFNPHLSAQLNINNLFDKKYWAGSFSSNTTGVYGTPRRAMLNVNYRW